MPPAPQAILEVIFTKRQAYGNLISIHITSRDTFSSLIARVRKLYFTGSTVRRIVFALYMIIANQELVVFTTDTASISWLDPEASLHSSRVFVQQLEFDSLLTSACLSAHLLSSSKPFVQLYPQLCSFPGRAAASKTLVLSLRFSPAKAVALFLVITAAAMLIGLACGICLHNLEAGLSIFASISATMAVLQGCVWWLRTGL